MIVSTDVIINFNVKVDYVDITVPSCCLNGLPVPGINGGLWSIRVEADTGKIVDWPDHPVELFIKVRDEGRYSLVGNGREVGYLINDYVPGGVVPEGGDYISLNIGRDGVIKNWPRELDITGFGLWIQEKLVTAGAGNE